MKGKLIMTVEQAADRVAWERVRNSGIGGSDIACIMGLIPGRALTHSTLKSMAMLNRKTSLTTNLYIGVRCLSRL